MEEQPRVFTKDAHTENVIINDKGMCILDFDDKGCSLAQFDTSKMLEQHWDSTRLSHEEQQKYRVELLKEYIDSCNSMSIKKIDSVELFVLHHLQSTLVKALSYASFAEDKPRKLPLALRFLNNAENSIDAIREYFSEEYKKRRKEYDALQESIKEIIRTF